MPDAQPHFTLETKDGICFVEFSDRKILEEIYINEIGDQLGKIIEEHRPINLLLNFRKVEHLSSAALGMLINLQKKIAGQSGRLKLSDINPQIFEVFKITRLNKVFEIHDSAAAAKASFAQA
ncbi:MAG: hypothetical protein HJJLKODD_00900 [Phycisphaerae bacterium]|nr:hypothetical protein [Phycisphaerae bacterium]